MFGCLKHILFHSADCESGWRCECIVSYYLRDFLFGRSIFNIKNYFAGDQNIIEKWNSVSIRRIVFTIYEHYSGSEVNVLEIQSTRLGVKGEGTPGKKWKVSNKWKAKQQKVAYRGTAKVNILGDNSTVVLEACQIVLNNIFRN